VKAAIRVFGCAARLAPERSEPYVYLGEAYRRNGDRDSAVWAWSQTACSGDEGKLSVPAREVAIALLSDALGIREAARAHARRAIFALTVIHRHGCARAEDDCDCYPLLSLMGCLLARLRCDSDARRLSPQLCDPVNL
jgi:hypothetical protein